MVSTFSEVMWLQMERCNEDEGEGKRSDDDKHWKVQQMLDEDDKEGKNENVEWLGLFRNELSLYLRQNLLDLSPGMKKP